MDREGGRFMSWLPLNWKTKALSNEGKTANDKDASGSDFREKLMQAASRLGGLMTEPSATEVNGFQPSDLNVALLPGHLEYTSADPQTDPKRREEHLHGSRWQDPFCSLFRVWQDPICTLFQTKNLAPCTQVENVDAGGSYTSGTPLYKSNATSRRFDLKYGVGTDCAVKQKDLNVASKSSQEVTWHLPPIQGYCQENLFRDMGFPPALIQRAILLHGVQADDSIILQFLLDWRENNNVLGSNIKKLADYSETKLTNDEINATEESVSGLLTVREQIENSEKKKGVEQLWGNDGSDPSDTDFDDDDEGAPPRNARSAIDWTAERGSDHLVSLCKRELPTREDHRHLMSSHGFAAQLVERAIQDLGEGVDYETLLEYLLYLTSQQDPTASTSQASCVKRGGPAKKVLKECKKQQKNYKGRLNIVEKLVEECGYPAKAVERAVIVCGTPLWNAEENQIADLVDFLAAHCAGLNESEDTAISEEDLQDDAHWSWLRQHLEEDVSTSGGAKGNLGCGTVTRRKTIVRLSRPPDLEREQHNKPPLSRAYNPERELSLNSKQSASPRHRMKLERSQRRYTPVGRIGRLRMVNMEVSTTVDRHNGSVGFGLPGNPVQPRYLDEDVEGAPFFYFENVASMPNDEWDRIRRHLFDIEPEFVDSLHFSACRRPRGYIHNLPTDGRRKILADPPMTIQELLPHTKPFWPAWDPRTKLNCITTRMGSEFLIKKLNIREGTALQTSDPSPEQQREILHLCRHWNLVWTSPNIPTPVDDSEIEAMLGFDAGHSRNILSNRSRYKALGNSFSVYTVAFHFSVLKPLYPKGVKVLSLFSGIGGAEVALHKMGIKLLVVVSVEIDDGTRRCLQAWWASSKQTGVLNQNYHNIKDLGRSQISELVNMYGGFDLIVGGTPCNNLSGSNHVTRVGLDGKQSTIFFEFSRVVTAVRELTIRLQRKK